MIIYWTSYIKRLKQVRLFLLEKAHIFLPGRMGKQGIILIQSLTELSWGWFIALNLICLWFQRSQGQDLSCVCCRPLPVDLYYIYIWNIMQDTNVSHLCNLKFANSYTEKRFKNTVGKSCNNVFNSTHPSIAIII